MTSLSLIKVTVIHDINRNNNNMEYGNTKVQFIDSNKMFKRTDYNGRCILDDVDDLASVYYPINSYDLENTKYIYILYVKGSAVHNTMVSAEFNKVWLDCDVCFNAEELLYSDFVSAELKKDIQDTIKFYTEDNGSGEDDEDFIYSLINKLDKHNIGLLKYDFYDDEDGYLRENKQLVDEYDSRVNRV